MLYMNYIVQDAEKIHSPDLSSAGLSYQTLKYSITGERQIYRDFLMNNLVQPALKWFNRQYVVSA